MLLKKQVIEYLSRINSIYAKILGMLFEIIQQSVSDENIQASMKQMIVNLQLTKYSDLPWTE